MKTRVLVLWKKVGDLYRAYATRYPEIKVEGSSPDDVERQMREIIPQCLAGLTNGNGNGSGEDLDIYVVEDERPECKPLPYRDWEGKEIMPDIDDYTYEIMIEFNRRLKPGMTREEGWKVNDDLLREEEEQGRKWYSSEEIMAELERTADEYRANLKGKS